MLKSWYHEIIPPYYNDNNVLNLLDIIKEKAADSLQLYSHEGAIFSAVIIWRACLIGKNSIAF